MAKKNYFDNEQHIESFFISLITYIITNILDVAICHNLSREF